MLVVAKEYVKEIAEIRKLYDTAEQDLKTVGREQNVLIVAGVNQCRYAGQHLSRALAATEHETVVEELAAANRHLRRAVYDINDAAIQFYLGEIEAFKKRFPINLSQHIPAYGNVMSAVVAAKEHIEEASQQNHGNRETLYDQVREDISALRTARNTLVAHESDCYASLRSANRARLTAWAAVAVSLLSGLALFLLRLL
ncbi:MAG: hypothetical protein OXQ27_07510 [Chloroflexota bacterium]|nr:hypothetical protein [Chloroflexota bacterium]